MAIRLNQPVAYDVCVASVIHDLKRAQRAESYDPDLAALYLDGALRRLMALFAGNPGGDALSAAQSLLALDQERPDIARRMRLALRAPHVEARLAHCWALLDLLNVDAVYAGAPRES